MATTTDIASKASKYREMAKDKALPQDVRNAYLDKANKLEEGTMKPTMAKGGVVASNIKMKQSALKKPSLVVSVSVGKGKKPMMAKGGAVKGKC